MGNKIIGLFMLILGLVACSENKSSISDAKTLTSKQRFIKSKNVDWLKMEVYMKPTSILLSRVAKNELTENEEFLALKEDVEKMAYFDLRLSVNLPGKHIENYKVHSQFEQDQRLQYLAFTMQEDLYLEQKGRRIPCELYHFERNYSLSPHRSFLLGFPRKDLLKGEDITFVFDSQYLQTGPLKIRYDAKNFSKASQIEL